MNTIVSTKKGRKEKKKLTYGPNDGLAMVWAIFVDAADFPAIFQ